MRHCFLYLLCFCLSASAAHAGEIKFSGKPSAKKDGEKVRITFAVNAANNVIGHFGKYGNQDSRGVRPGEKAKKSGGGSPGEEKAGGPAVVKKPAIPMAWPITCVASDTHVYVGDTINRRVVKVKLAAAAEETCPAGP